MALKEIIYKEKRFSISYEIVNLKESRDIIFLHGWGSNKEVMKSAFKNSLKNFRHIYIDMPGFGKSPNSEVLKTKDYANIIELFLKESGFKKDIIVGHSFGGKVATLLNPKLLVLLSSAGILEKKPLKVRAKITLFKLLKPFGGKKIREFFVSKDAKKMSENMYETFKNVVDEDFSYFFEKYEGEVLIFWGDEDGATSLKSGEKIASLIRKSSFYPLKGDHYFFLQNSDFISKKIEDSYENV
ncbi:alpha/beta fold hydrolase [Nitrosophilus labii]|uniref:alpha/beta fold hydrolase n=1 Tax=Nitrosophilus labii TaxID=2706014 RepID=UPI001656E6A9|nr:alpha/beta hydrolase [Nitrosophilus labii]